MDTVKYLALGVLTGARDAVWGITAVRHLDTYPSYRRSESSDSGKDRGSPDRPSTTLAQRRAHSGKPRHKSEEPKVVHRIFQCCALNGGVFWMSIIAFNYMLLPCVHMIIGALFGEKSGPGRAIWGWLQPLLSYTFEALWVLPLFVLSRVVNSLWFQDIADLAYRHLRGRPQLLPSLSRLVADTLFSVLVQALFLLQSLLVGLLPISALSHVVSLLHLSLLYSLYAFEYKWFNMGWELHRRLSFIEENWPYFVGFGLPLAVLTSLPSSFFISGCIFSILFPLFIISGHEAMPVTGTCHYPLQLFSLAVWVSNAIFRQLTTSPQMKALSLGSTLDQHHLSPKRPSPDKHGRSKRLSPVPQSRSQPKHRVPR